MTKVNIINNGARVPVAFDFYTGMAAIARREGAATATIAVRESLRGASPGPGLVDGEPVEAVKIQKSPNVSAMTLIDIVFSQPQGDAP